MCWVLGVKRYTDTQQETEFYKAWQAIISKTWSKYNIIFEHLDRSSVFETWIWEYKRDLFALSDFDCHDFGEKL